MLLFFLRLYGRVSNSNSREQGSSILRSIRLHILIKIENVPTHHLVENMQVVVGRKIHHVVDNRLGLSERPRGVDV